MFKPEQPYLIGETAFHHQGETKFLSNLIDDISEMGFDAIKFHLLLTPEEYMVKYHKVIDTIRNWIFNKEEWSGFFDQALTNNLELILLCNDVSSVQFVRALNKPVRAIEIHATGINDYFLLEEASQFDGTIILGIGGSSVDEIQYAVDLLNSFGKNDIFLMYGFQNYPTKYEDINLSKMLKINQLFELPLGYADHTDPDDPEHESLAALGIALGINVLEKHYSPDSDGNRVDSEAAISKEQFLSLSKKINAFSKARGSGSLQLSEAEKKYGNVGPMKKALVAANDIPKGKKIEESDLAFKRTNESSYVSQMLFPKIVGLEVQKDIAKDEIIDFKKLAYDFKVAEFNEFIKKY